MKLKNAKFERYGPFFSEENRNALELFKEKFPLSLEDKDIELKVHAKVYSQDIFSRGDHINTIFFYVVAVVPSQSFTDWSIDFRKIRVNDSLKSFSGRYEFPASINLIPGNFFIKLHTIPTDKIDLSPPEDFQSRVNCKNMDFI